MKLAASAVFCGFLLIAAAVVPVDAGNTGSYVPDGIKNKLLIVKPYYEAVDEAEALGAADFLIRTISRTGLFDIVMNEWANIFFLKWEKLDKQPFLFESLNDMAPRDKPYKGKAVVLKKWDAICNTMGKKSRADIVLTTEITGLGDFYSCRLRTYDVSREKSIGSIYEKSEAGEELNPFLVRVTWKLLRKIYAEPANIGARININTEDTDVLMLLPGMDASSAGKIIAFRKEHGDYACYEDLLAAGVKLKQMKKMRSRLVFEK